MPSLNLLEHWLAPSLRAAESVVQLSGNHALEYTLMAVSVGIALAGIGLARAFYLGGWSTVPRQLAEGLPGTYRLLLDKYRVDELYALLVLRPFQVAARELHRLVDAILIDLVGVRGTAAAAMVAGRALRFLQTGQTQQYLAGMLVAAAVVGALVML